MALNTNMHVTRVQAREMLRAVEFKLNWDTSGEDRTQLEGCKRMLQAALSRIRDLEDRTARR